LFAGLEQGGGKSYQGRRKKRVRGPEAATKKQQDAADISDGAASMAIDETLGAR